jgi:small multidrug resistance family-3 protein
MIGRGIVLFVYVIVPTLQPAQFGRIYAAYGGMLIVFAIIWGRMVDKRGLINMNL